MRLTIAFAGLFGLMSILGVSHSALAGDVAFAKVKLVYTFNGEKMFKSNAIVKPGSEVRLTLDHPTKKPSYQLRYTLSPPRVSSSGQAVANLSLQVFEGQKGNWTLRSDPQISVILDQQASVSAPARFESLGMGTYALSVTAKPMTAQEVQTSTGLTDLSIKDCGSHKNSLLSPGSGVHPNLKQACCSSACAGGSIWYGYTMTCCGAVSCSACGTSCSP